MKNLMVLIPVLVSCGMLEDGSDCGESSKDTKELKECSANVDNETGNEAGDNVDVGKDVKFSGYVMKAFSLTVNGEEFSDTEDFYTRFIDVFIKNNPKYSEDLEGAQIEVEGNYGLTTFGRYAPVFMASQEGDGHIFETKTDSKGKFSLDVIKNALDETFKARVIVRIGLSIKYESGETDSFCYLLYGFRENISIGENTKPIIFDEYDTQLNTWRCSEKTDKELVIPIQIADKSGEDVEIPEDDMAEKGTVVVDPFIKVVAIYSIALPLASDEVLPNNSTRGIANELVNISYDAEKQVHYVLMDTVRNTTNGNEYQPIYKITDLTNDQIQSTKLKTSEEHGRYIKVLEYADSLIYFQRNHSYGKLYDSQGNILHNGYIVNLFKIGSTLHGRSGNSVCSIDFNTKDILQNCIVPPSSNSQLFRPSDVFYHNDLIYSLRKSYNRFYLTSYNTSIVQQKEYVISKLINNIQGMTHDNEAIYIYHMDGDNLIMRQIELVE